MQTFNIIVRAFEQFDKLRMEAPLPFWIICIVNAVCAIFVLYKNIQVAKNGLWDRLTLLGKLLYILLLGISCLVLPVISVFFVCADILINLQTENLFNNRYYIEIIVIAILSALLSVKSYSKEVKQADSPDADSGIDFLETFGKNIILIILSIIFIFTDLEKGLSSFGFQICGKKIGGWLYGAYAAWSGAVVITFIRELIGVCMGFLFRE